MKLVESSLLNSWAYDDTAKQLWLRFKHERKLYRYDNVPADVVKAMTEAPSIGSFITRNVVKQFVGVLIEEIE